MAEYLSSDIATLVEKIRNQEIILPAMQRNFVWPEEKIYHLFDSLMRNYPIGTFLFWDIKKDIYNQYAFNQIIKNVDDSKGKVQRGDSVTEDLSKYTAVLDGQQRITAIYVGVTGKWHTHIKNRKWDDTTAYYDRYLCIDLLVCPQNEEEEYSFKFVKGEEIEKISTDGNGEKHYWIKLATVFEPRLNASGKEIEFDPADYIDYFCIKNPDVIFTHEERRERRLMLERLKDALRKNNVISYFESRNKSLAEVVEIFVRVNSGGQSLSASDLMLSVATGSLGNTDVHLKIQKAISDINASVIDEDNGFKVDKELILTAGLYFTGAKSLSLKKKENYEQRQMDAIFKTNWDNITEALSNTIQYIEYLGFNGNKLSSKNLILPVAYYFYKNKLNSSHKSSMVNRAACDRIFIRQWMLRALINEVFMDGTGSTLVRIRDVLDAFSGKYFPLDELMKAKIKKPLDISQDQIDEILSYEYGDAKIFPLLMDLSNRTTDRFHVDHIWPKSLLLTKKGVKSKYPSASDDEIKAFKNNCNKIVNLQLLTPIENQEKSDTTFDVWVKMNHPFETDDYFEKNVIPKAIPYEFNYFITFTEAREKMLRERIKKAFPDDFNKIVIRYALQDKIK